MRAVQVTEQDKKAKTKSKEVMKEKVEDEKQSNVRVGDLGIPIDEPREQSNVEVDAYGIPIDDSLLDPMDVPLMDKFRKWVRERHARDLAKSSASDLTTSNSEPAKVGSRVKRKSLGLLDGWKPVKRKSGGSVQDEKTSKQVSAEIGNTDLSADMSAGHVRDEAGIMLDSLEASEDEDA
ncbi:hypothetical protein Slin15195_G079200 [Septoria linicola]|uniref:Uncharacterized protein n=1 Tax=Septoria linicola TaxID=215465 RepID=A0A9Q9EKA2_9PEZI|nr:hypothetical protein Slin14017_G040400 [Septoria linicola]USW54601.1 hypothetical protein Slin15195_G079200 [Septoria linicola]